MERTEIASKIRKIAADLLGFAPEQVTLESKIVEDLRGDSLDQIELVMDIEDEFDLEIPDEDAEGIQTIGQVVDYVCAKLEAKTQPVPSAQEGATL